MAYIEFLSERLQLKEDIFFNIVQAAYRITNFDSIYIDSNKTVSITKIYSDNEQRVEEKLRWLSDCIDLYNDYLKFDELDRFVYSNLVEGKKLIPLFSADKVRCKRLLYEFAKEYLKLHTENYLLIDQTELYDLKRIESLD